MSQKNKQNINKIVFSCIEKKKIKVKALIEMIRLSARGQSWHMRDNANQLDVHRAREN